MFSKDETLVLLKLFAHLISIFCNSVLNEKGRYEMMSKKEILLLEMTNPYRKCLESKF